MLPVKVANVTFGESAERAEVVLGCNTTMTQNLLCTSRSDTMTAIMDQVLRP